MIDISTPLSSDTPRWPDSPGITTSSLLSLAGGDVANTSLLEMDVHTGTHVDAPRHFLPHGKTIDQIGLDPLVGSAYVADIANTRTIDHQALDGLRLPAATERLLLRTANSTEPRFRTGEFARDYAALTLSGAQWIAERGLRLVGIDYLSIQLFDDPPATHHVLLGGGVTILEGLELGHVSPGEYELVCLPLRLVGTEAAPARAILRPIAVGA